MPRFPDLAARNAYLPPGTFTGFGERLQEQKRAGKLVPLHIGDTHAMPPEESTRVDLGVPAIHRYTQVAGDAALRAEVADALLPPLGVDVPADGVVIAAGATGGLLLAAAAVCDPGDEVIVLTPSWPLIFGILPTVGARAVMVSVGEGGWPERDPRALAARLASAVTERTVAIYFSDPNNPVGYVFSPEHRAAIAGVAREHDLWVLHDAVYAQLRWAGEPVRWVGAVPPERLVTAGSFSKVYALAGQRVGFLALPEPLRPAVRRLVTHVIYHAPTSGQAMALAALRSRGYAEAMCEQYRSAADLARAHLPSCRFHDPDAGAFVFLDLREAGAPHEEILLRCLDRHVALAPGSLFGTGFEAFARLCYTAVPPDEIAAALDAVDQVIGSLG
jgi:aspartate/methionine/tyrosine aminotransferase